MYKSELFTSIDTVVFFGVPILWVLSFLVLGRFLRASGCLSVIQEAEQIRSCVCAMRPVVKFRCDSWRTWFDDLPCCSVFFAIWRQKIISCWSQEISRNQGRERATDSGSLWPRCCAWSWKSKSRSQSESGDTTQMLWWRPFPARGPRWHHCHLECPNHPKPLLVWRISCGNLA